MENQTPAFLSHQSIYCIKGNGRKKVFIIGFNMESCCMFTTILASAVEKEKRLFHGDAFYAFVLEIE